MTGKKSWLPTKIPFSVAWGGSIKEQKQTLRESCSTPEFSIAKHANYRVSSPYAQDFVHLHIGFKSDCYLVPRPLIMQNPKLAEYFDDGRQYIRLLDIEAEIGHTFVHYLYTGQYHTLEASGLTLKEQYRRSVLTYKASLRYSIPPLEDLSKQQMERLGSAVGIFDMIAVASQEYFNIQWYSSWYAGYLEEMVTTAFTADKGIFSRVEFTRCLGASPCFLVFMMQLMNKVYSCKVQNYIERMAESKAKATKSSSSMLSCERCTERCHRKQQGLEQSTATGAGSYSSKESINNSSPAEIPADQRSLAQSERDPWTEPGSMTEEDKAEWDRFSLSETTSYSGLENDSNLRL